MRQNDLQAGARKGFNARALCVAAALSAAALSGGCYQDRAVRQVTPMPPEPVADQATQLRDWSQAVCYYHSGTVQAWPTRWYLEKNPDQETRLDYVLEPLLFIAQTVTLPVTLVLEPPFERVYYEGDVVPPTYTAMPPLPPKPAVSPANPYPDPLAQPKPPRVPGPPIDRRWPRMERTAVPETTAPATTAPEATAPATAPDTAPNTAPATVPDTAPATTAPNTAPATTPDTAPATTAPVPAPQPAPDPAPTTLPPPPEPNK